MEDSEERHQIEIKVCVVATSYIMISMSKFEKLHYGG